MKKTPIFILILGLLLSGCTTVADSSALITAAPAASLSENSSVVDSAVEASEDPCSDLLETGLFKNRELSGDYDESDAIPLTSENAEITQGGTYILSGSLTDTTITVSVADTEKVQIVLDNATIENQNAPAIYVAQADKVYITAREGTENYIADGVDYTYPLDEKADAAIFSRCDLAINGSGSLTVSGNYKHAVVSKDDLVLAIDQLSVTAEKIGLYGQDSVRVAWGNLDIQSGGDGIQSDNEEDTDKGFVYVADCHMTIQSGKDGIQGEHQVTLVDGTYQITAGGGANSTTGEELESYKGIKSGTDIFITHGDFQLDCLDDTIHANNNISISGGNFTLSTGDDGVHADQTLDISGGNILITESYEGLEATVLNISGGTMDITSSDDGLNAAGDSEETDFDGFPGPFGAGVGEINISGGYIVINAEGDGIDSNDTMLVSGGVVLVSGPTMSMNGALDCDGGSTITGGVVIATGAAGMAQGFTTAENQGSILVNLGNQTGGTSIALCDETGNVIAAFTPATDYSTLAISAPGIQTDNTYTVVVGGQVDNTDEHGFAENTTITGGETISTIEMTELVYSEGGFGGPGGGFGGFGGGFGGDPGRNGGFPGESSDNSPGEPPEGEPGNLPDNLPEDFPENFDFSGTPPDGAPGDFTPPDGNS